MQSLHADVVGGFNTFLASQQSAQGTAELTLVQFDTQIETVMDGVDIQEVKPFRNGDFVPRGSTALYDAMGSSMDKLGFRLAARQEKFRPENVVVAVMTDGEENASRRFTFGQIQERIEHQRSFYNWEFVFLASELRTLDISRQLGVAEDKSMRWDKSSHGVSTAFSSMSAQILDVRMGKEKNLDFLKEIQD
jgi:uncharacterized protein YegL